MTKDLRVVAFMKANAGQEGTVREAILACVRQSRKEEGNISYAAHVDQADPSLFVVVEHWKSAEARDKHLHSEHFQVLKRVVDEERRLSEHRFHVLVPLASDDIHETSKPNQSAKL